MNDPLETISKLNAERLPAAWQDNAASLTGQAEQARFVALASLGTMAVLGTGVFASSKPVCVPFLELAFDSLMLAAILGWTGYGLVSAAWDARSAMRLSELNGLTARVTGNPSKEADDAQKEASRHFIELRTRSRWFTGLGAVFGWLSAPLILEAIKETLSAHCSVSAWAKIGATFDATAAALGLR